MKKIALVGAALTLAMAAGSAMAANSLNAGTFGLNVPVTSTGNMVTDPIITGKYFVGKDMAVLGGFGFSSGGPSGASVTTMQLLVGVRKYMKIDDFAPFVGGVFSYSTISTNPSTTGMTLAAEGGAEYFLAKQFSIEGKAQFGYMSTESGGAKSSYIGTTTGTLSVNYYF